jgi:hypothetical protein
VVSAFPEQFRDIAGHVERTVGDEKPLAEYDNVQ